MRLLEDQAQALYLRGLFPSYLFLRPKLVNHAVNFADRRSGSFCSEKLKGVDILGFHGFFSSLHDHTTFHPHLNSFCNGQVRAFGNKCRGKFGVTGAQYFIIERLLSPSARSLGW